jgi:chorismate synthase
MIRPPYELRELQGLHELHLVETLERRIWGDGNTPTQPELLRAMQDEGALLAGAFTPDRALVAFVFGFPTRDSGLQHSHSLGVLEAHRAAGLGARLKWFQRAWCLERGIRTVRWTFDPLRAPNAKLNIAKLGAVAGTYLEDYYGALTGINAGAPSDRVMAEWVLEHPRVLSRLEGSHTVVMNAPEVNPRAGEHPGPIEFNLDAPRIKMRLPMDYSSLLGKNPALALEWRWHGRSVLQRFFARGYRITEFTLEGGPSYLLERELS